MDYIFDHISSNKSLKFIDVKTNSIYKLNELLLPTEELALKGRQLIFLYLSTSLESVAVYLSFLASKHPVVLLNNGIGAILKQNLEKEYKPSIIYDVNRNEIINYSLKEIKNKAINISVFINDNSSILVHETIRLLLSTSGTTGSPKLVKLSEHNILQNALSICDYLPINKKDIVPLNLPLNYSYGLSVLHSNAIKGGTIVCGLPDILTKDFWRCLDVYKFTSIAGVPFIYEMLNRIGFLKKHYPSLKYISQAGGNLSENIKMQFIDYCRENNIEFFVMYGQTEATARISYVPSDRLVEKVKSIGIPINNGKMIIDAETEELLYSGPNVFGGYAKKKEDLKFWETINPLKTGDLAFKDEDGFYHIKGRLKRMVKVFGNRVNLDEIEALLKSSLDMSLLACTGINDKFILVAHCEDALNESQLKKTIFETYKIQGPAIKFKRFDKLPKTKNEKIDYKKIAEEYLEN